MLEMFGVCPANNPGSMLSVIWLLTHALMPRQAHNDNDATPAQCNRPNPDRGKSLSANVIGLHILEVTV